MSVEPSIQFTLTREKDRHMPFLDLNVSRGVQGNLETSVYRKPTHTDKYLAFDSHHPICHKKSVAKTLLRRADCLPSSLDSKAEERKYVSNVLKANGYTKTFLFSLANFPLNQNLMKRERWRNFSPSRTSNCEETLLYLKLFDSFNLDSAWNQAFVGWENFLIETCSMYMITCIPLLSLLA